MFNLPSQKKGNVSIAGMIFPLDGNGNLLLDPNRLDEQDKILRGSPQFKSGVLVEITKVDKNGLQAPQIKEVFITANDVPTGIFTVDELKALDALPEDDRKIIRDNAISIFADVFPDAKVFKESSESAGDDENKGADTDNAGGDSGSGNSYPTEEELLKEGKKGKMGLKRYFDEYEIDFDKDFTMPEMVALIVKKITELQTPAE